VIGLPFNGFATFASSLADVIEAFYEQTWFVPDSDRMWNQLAGSEYPNVSRRRGNVRSAEI
jgi:hypothetical protein